jgi:membrane protease YdiL (CAAX protease family)
MFHPFPTMRLATSTTSIGVDLKIAGTLAAATALFGGITVPLLLPSIFELVPPAQRTLPLPLPLFSVLVATQFLLFYGALAWAGLRLARARNREPAPWLTSVWSRQRTPDSASGVGLAFGTGLICGLILVGAIALIKHFLPQTLPAVLHPSSFLGSLSASITASFSEEILCRLFLLSALLRILPRSMKGTVIAVAVSSLIFGALHTPSAVFLFGGLDNVPALAWVWVMSLNALVGVACGVWYLRGGIGCAIIVHFGTDLVWHVLSQLF